MEFGYISNDPDLKRVPQERNQVDKITEYGIDNLYPQRIKEVMNLSPITKSTIELQASFIRGDGFERGDKIVNDQNETANDILRLISFDKSLFDGYCLHINGSAIGKTTSIDYVDFEFVRLGLMNQNGNINDCRVSINWEESSKVLPTNDKRIQRFTLYDPAKQGEEVLTTGKGMLLYASPRKNTYPISNIDAIIEACQADYELQVYTLSQINNGFLNLSVFKYPSGGDTETEEEELSKKLNQLKGARNANSILVASIDEDYEGGSLIEQFPAINGDSLFINSTINTRNTILGNMALPRSLVGYTPEGSLFTSQQIADDYTYMNLRTKDIRNEIERQFDKLGLNLGKIIPNQFESSQMKDDVNQPR